MVDEQFQKILEQIKDHEKRIRELEESILIHGPKQKPRKIRLGKDKYSGLTGGLRLLIEDGFFKSKKDLASVRRRLESKDYYYSRQAVHEVLKAFSKPGGFLVVLKERGKRVYAERK